MSGPGLPGDEEREELLQVLLRRLASVLTDFEGLGGGHALRPVLAVEFGELRAVALGGLTEAAGEAFAHLAIAPGAARVVARQEALVAVRAAFEELRLHDPQGV